MRILRLHDSSDHQSLLYCAGVCSSRKGRSGTLAGSFSHDAERQGYRDLYAGVVGAFRNPYAHRLTHPTPEDGGAFIVFVNLLLKMLKDLRRL